MPYIEKGNVKRFFIRQLQLAEGMRISGGQKRVHGQFEGFEGVAGIGRGMVRVQKASSLVSKDSNVRQDGEETEII